MLGEPIAAK